VGLNNKEKKGTGWHKDY